jgi:hypothetical protein
VRPDLALVPEVDEALYFPVLLKDCHWALHDLMWEHVFPMPDQPISSGPIEVERLNWDGWFVRDGRHRCIRAMLRGEKSILAKHWVFRP